MKKSRYTEEKIIGVTKQMEAGRKVADLARDPAAEYCRLASTLPACTHAAQSGQITC